MAKLISDVHEFGQVKFLTESKKQENGKSTPMYILEGCACVAEQKNGNGRVYPYELLKDEIERFDKEFVKTGRALCALEHPEYPEIRPEDACARTLEVKEAEGKVWTAKSCILAS